jgi:hypothetical protein
MTKNIIDGDESSNSFIYVWIMKLRISTFKNNGKLRWNLRIFIHYLRTKLYTDYLQKKKVTPSPMAFAGTSFMALRIPVVSMDFSDLCHQAHYIFWMIIVGVDLPFQVHPKIFIQPYL